MSGLTQALIISATGVVMMILITMTLGTVVDYFLWFSTTLEIQNPILRQCMDSITIFGRWFYLLIFYIALVFVAYPFIWLVKIHSYEDVVPADANYGYGS